MKVKLTHAILLLNNVDNVRDFGSFDFRMELADIVVSAKLEYDKYTLASKESKDFKYYVEAKQAIFKTCMVEPNAEQKKNGLKQVFKQEEFSKQLTKLDKQYAKAIELNEETNQKLKEESLNKVIEIDAKPINRKNVDDKIPLNMLTILKPFISTE